LGRLNVDEDVTEVRLFRGHSDTHFGLGGLGDIGLILLPIIFIAVPALHFFRRLKAQTSSWENYFGPYVCRLEENELVLWSVELFSFPWKKKSEMKRIPISDLCSHSLCYSETKLFLKYKSGKKETLVGGKSELSELNNRIRTACEALAVKESDKPKLEACAI